MMLWFCVDFEMKILVHYLMQLDICATMKCNTDESDNMSYGISILTI